jgi:hypothetical protein
VRIADLFPHELVHPVVARGTAFLGHQAGDYERHLECACSGCEVAFGEEGEDRGGEVGDVEGVYLCKLCTLVNERVPWMLET